MRKKGGKRSAKTNTILGWKPIPAPGIVDFFLPETHEEVLKFMNDLASRSHGRKRLLDFRETERMTANAVLYLYARISELKLETGYKFGILQSSISHSVNRLIQCSGILDLVSNRSGSSQAARKLLLPIKQGDCSPQGMELWHDIVDYIQEVLVDEEIVSDSGSDEDETKMAVFEGLYANAVSEAVNNVRLHAYPSENFANGPAQHKWWVICSVFDSNLYLCICDLGIGIPTTLISKEYFPKLARLLKMDKLGRSELKDSKLIESSMELGKTGLKKQKHGTGMPTIKQLVEDNPDGELWIFSGKGIYNLNQKNQVKTQDAKQDIGGTIVQWNIRLRHEDKHH